MEDKAIGLIEQEYADNGQDMVSIPDDEYEELIGKTLGEILGDDYESIESMTAELWQSAIDAYEEDGNE